MAVLRILGRTALVAFFIFTLVIVAFAQDPSAQTPTVVVNDQAALNGNVTIEQITVPQQAFLVIQRDLAGTAGSSLGRVAVQTGTTENVVVPLEAVVVPGDQLYAALYLDAGLVGVFEVPGADTPFLLNNQLLAQPFLITAATDPQAQATVQPTQTQQTEPTTAPTGLPTVTVTGQLTTPVILTLTATPTGPFPVSATLTSTLQSTIQSLPQAITQTVTQPITQSVAQPTSPLPTPPSTPTSIPTATPAPTLAPTLTLSPTVQPTSLQVVPVVSTTTPTQIPTVQLFVQPQIQPTTAMPARLPVTGANSGANLPTTLLGSALAFVLFVGGNRLRQRLS